MASMRFPSQPLPNYPGLYLPSLGVTGQAQPMSYSPVEAPQDPHAYMAQAQAGKGLVCNWPADLRLNLPIYYCIRELPPTSAQLLHRQIEKALKLWTETGEGRIGFLPSRPLTYCPKPALAGITLLWQEETVHGRSNEVGHTVRSLRQPLTLSGAHTIQSATITLITHPKIDGMLTPAQRQQRILTTLLHELGHALGLEHSVSPQDVMFHQGWKVARLSPNDKRRLLALYSA